jgi:hypothetical protein
MQVEALELRLSLLVCLALSGVYVVYELLSEPSGGQPFGHWLGIFGTLLMASTEVLYSLRKRTGWLRRAGPVRYWLSAHIFTGIVGPFLVLLHSAFQFRGLAGFTLGLTALVALSGFLGRYLYTAIPHTLAGTETTAGALMMELDQVLSSLENLAQAAPPVVKELVDAEVHRPGRRSDWAIVVLRAWDEWRHGDSLHGQIRKLETKEGHTLGNIERLLRTRYRLERQLRTIRAARRLLSLWHIAHVPMGFVLFSSVAIHVVATIYFGASILR